jgi:hypothetical protein
MPMPSTSRPAPLLWRVWLGISVWAAVAGWGLSAVGQLHAAGYAVAALLGVVAGAWAWRKEIPGRGWQGRNWRWRRTAPRLFAGLALAAGLGGALYAPSNYDTFWYRLPRVLHWLDAGRWHWIPTSEGRYNFLATGMEWFHAPLLAWSDSYRLLFLPNLAAFLLLPGLGFAVFRGLRVPGRTAWWWMWLFPSAWVFVSQAGSVANDLTSAVHLLAAVAFALRARRTLAFGDLAWSLLAAALATNSKQTNLPLLLPWLVVLLPALSRLRFHPGATLGLLALGLVASVVPNTLANLLHTGHWSGWSPAERNFVPTHPLFAAVANTAILLVHNLLPPWVPGAAALNQSAAAFASRHPEWVRGFEFFGAVPTSFDEAWAGPGLFLTLLAFPYVFRRHPGPALRTPFGFALALGVATFVLLTQMGCRQPARYLAPYFPLLLAVLLRRPGTASVVRHRFWPAAATLALLGALAYTALLKARPLVPIRPLLVAWAQANPDHPLARRLQGRLGPSGPRLHPFETFVPALAGVKRVGFAALTAGEPYLWDRAVGRRVVPVPRSATRTQLDQLGLEYVVINDLGALYDGRADGLAWAEAAGGEVVASAPLSLAEVRARRAAGGLPSVEDLAYQRATHGVPAVDNAYLVRRPVTSLAPSAASR